MAKRCMVMGSVLTTVPSCKAREQPAGLHDFQTRSSGVWLAREAEAASNHSPHSKLTAVANRRIASEMDNHLGWLNSELQGRQFFVGNELTGADINLSFVAQMALRYAGRDAYPNLTAFVDRIEARPAYQRAIARSGA